MSRKPSHARHRADTTAKALTAEAQRLGLTVVTLGGTIHAAICYGSVVRLVEFKSADGGLQPSQAALVAKGVPIVFISTPQQIEALAADLKREALR